MIRFRPIYSNDLALILEWLQRPHVKEWWDDGDDTIEKVAAHYLSDAEMTKRFIVRSFDGRDAGYFQYHCYNPHTSALINSWPMRRNFLGRRNQLPAGILRHDPQGINAQHRLC